MKTLFALLTGVALGTIAALWLAARRLRDEPAHEVVTAATAVAEAAPLVPEPASEEALS